MSAATRPLVVLGPTASGKSDVAMALARRDRRFEIVAVDAMQVYREMDIGTAKPTQADRADVMHHCLDLADPADEFSVVDFVASATAALAGISARGSRPILVAGTGLYLRALTDPMDVPGRWPEVRAGLEARLLHEGPESLHADLSRHDPLGASRMEPTNARRVVRALEVTLGSGRPFSSHGPGLHRYPPVGFDQVGLLWERGRLAERIEQRVWRMLEAGLLAEIAALVSRPRGLSRTARQALGYKELIEHLDGRVGLDEAVATVVARTRRFAVRQERWFRRDPRIRWVRVHDDPVAEALSTLAEADGSLAPADPVPDHP